MKLHVSEATFDWNTMRWRVIISDDYHTWRGEAFWLSIAFMLAFGRYVFDPDRR